MSATVGIGAARRRWAVALAAAGLGLLNVTLAALHHPVLRLGPLHAAIPLLAVTSGRYLLLAAGSTLLSSVRGLVHGKRQAWLLATTASLASVAIHPMKGADYVGLAASMAVVATLLVSAPLFPARSDPLRVRTGVAWLLIGEAAVFIYGVVGAYLLDEHFVESTTWWDSMENAARLLFILPSSTIDPATHHGAWFIDSVRVSALAVYGIAAWHLLQPVVHRAGAGRAEHYRVEEMLAAYATNSIAYFHLLPDTSYYFGEAGDAFIGYRVVGRSAIALGEPVGTPAGCRAVAPAFAEFCELNGWVFGFHQVSEAGAQLLREVGLRTLKIGEEAVIPVQEFSLAGKSFKHIRNAVNRLERDGYTVEELAQPLDGPTIAELREVSDAWLADGGHRERSFTLGAFDAAYLRSTRVLAVRAANSTRIEAFANLLPPFQSRQGNFDLMRRRPDAPDGVMDFLFVAMIGLFREAGLDGMNLGFAPLANVEGSGPVAAALRLLYERGSRAFNFRGLRAYKDKWHPRWEPRYLAYRSDLQLPGLALAVARVGEIDARLPLPFRIPFWRPRTPVAGPAGPPPPALPSRS